MSPGNPSVLLAFAAVLSVLTTGVGALRPAGSVSRRQALCTGATCAAAVASAAAGPALAVEEVAPSAVLDAGSVFTVVPDGAQLRPSVSMLGTSRALDSLCAPGVKAVFLGEHHNAAQDHALQTALLTEMRRRQPAREMAVGLEAVQRRFQPALDAYTGACRRFPCPYPTFADRVPPLAPRSGRDVAERAPGSDGLGSPMDVVVW